MARIRLASARFRPGAVPAVLLAAALACVLAPPGPAGARDRPLSHGPVIWYAQDDRPVPLPDFEEPGLIPYGYESFVARPFSRFWHPGRALRRLVTDDPVQEASNLNSLDEVVDSTWFTNRIGLRRLTLQQLAEGPAYGTALAAGPDRSEPWVIIGAKTAGVTPGFRVRDARGDVWLLKFDPPEHPGMTIRAGVVSNLLFHAIGFNTPVDRLVEFDRRQLVVGEGATMRLTRGEEVPMTEANLDSVLTATRSVFGGRYHALASRYLDGRPLGPFDDQGRRAGDPNDLIDHENRRELRALKVFGAWVNHFDTKAHNSLDMYVGPEGEGHVRHYLIDFASTLGAYGDQPVPRYGFEYGFDVFPILGRIFTLGLVEDAWANAQRPAGLGEVGLFEADSFDPGKWKPDLPNSQMANLTRLDGYWAAKVLSAFTEEDLRIILAQAEYQDPRSVEYLTRVLLERRDRIVRRWFDKVPPLDFFRIENQRMVATDLAVEHGLVESGVSRYRARLRMVNAEREGGPWSPWQESEEPAIAMPGPIGADAFSAVEFQVDRGGGWSATTTVYRSLRTGRVVAVER